MHLIMRTSLWLRHQAVGLVSISPILKVVVVFFLWKSTEGVSQPTLILSLPGHICHSKLQFYLYWIPAEMSDFAS